MSVFTYYGPKNLFASEINPEALKHSYFVLRTPDGKGLVPGMLHQGRRPRIGKWQDITTIQDEFPVRYFVQHTDYNTLVPGSLIQSDRLPAGRWKEVKKPAINFFYRIVFSSGIYSVGTIASETVFTTDAEFVPDKLIPVLEEILPGITKDYVYGYLSYFKGDFDELGKDISKLIYFSEVGGYFRNFINFGSGQYGSLVSSDPMFPVQMKVRPNTPAGTYSFIFRMEGHVHGRIVYHYVVLENIFVKS